jgi:hypothetical protein
MTFQRSTFAFVFLFFATIVALTQAFAFIDCDLISSDVYNTNSDLLYSHVPFEYERNFYYNFTFSPIQDPVVVGLQLSHSRGSVNLTTTLLVNDQLVVQDSSQDLISIPIFFLNTACGTENHIKYITSDNYSQYNNGRRVRYESCNYGYELFLYNPPCQTVFNLYY